MFWLWEKNEVENKLMFQSLLSSAAQSQRCFSFSYHPASKGVGSTRSWEGIEPGHLTQMAKGIFHAIWYHAKKNIFTLLTTSCAHTLRFEEGRMTYREQTASMWCQSNMFIGRPLSRIRILETGWRHHANILMCFSTSMWFTTTVSVYGYFLRVLGVV